MSVRQVKREPVKTKHVEMTLGPVVVPVPTETYHALWAELHSQIEPSPDWFSDWLSRVPSFGCSCRNHADTYIANHPVDYDNFEDWAIAFHNSVNVRIGKPFWTKP